MKTLLLASLILIPNVTFAKTQPVSANNSQSVSKAQASVSVSSSQPITGGPIKRELSDNDKKQIEKLRGVK